MSACMSKDQYLHQLILPVVQLNGFDPTGQAAVDARAIQTHKHSQLVGRPVWICGDQKERLSFYWDLRTYSTINIYILNNTTMNVLFRQKNVTKKALQKIYTYVIN